MFAQGYNFSNKILLLSAIPRCQVIVNSEFPLHSEIHPGPWARYSQPNLHHKFVVRIKRVRTMCLELLGERAEDENVINEIKI